MPMHKIGSHGFSILELVIAIAILGLLLSAGVASYSSAARNTRNTNRRVDFEQIRSSLEAFRTADPNSSYPTSLNQIVPGFMAELPRDPQSNLPFPTANYYPSDCLSGCTRCSTYRYHIPLESTTGTLFLVGSPLGIVEQTTAPGALACP